MFPFRFLLCVLLLFITCFYYVFLHVIMCVYFYLFYFFICMNLKNLSPICTYTTHTLHSSPTSLPTATCMTVHTFSFLHETKPSIHMPTCMEPCLHVPSPLHLCMIGWFPFTFMHSLHAPCYQNTHPSTNLPSPSHLPYTLPP